MTDHGFITTLVAAVVLAFLLGFLAQRLKLPPLVGYMGAGILVGPHTPGYVGDMNLAQQLAEIGVILLMFGVGLKISAKELWETRAVALPGALVQMATATLLGLGVGLLLGFPLAETALLGMCLSVASTVVLLRALEARRMVGTRVGRLVVGWLVVEDIAIVLLIVALPAVTASLLPGESQAAEGLGATLTLTLVKIGAFVGLMTLIGGRVFPWLIVRVAHSRSRELLSLGTLALALGVAYTAYAVFDASFALGAFLAGVSLNGTRMSSSVAENSLPLRDTFAVLFFVAVGMLFDWHILVERPGAVVLLVAIIVIGKGLAALLIARALGTSKPDSFHAAAALAQIGEFSFLLAGMGLSLGVMSEESHALVIAAALISIMINPLLFQWAARSSARHIMEEHQA